MTNAAHAERRLPLRWLALLVAASLAFVVFPPFHVRPLRRGVAPAAVAGAIDVPRAAERFWSEKLVAPAVEPVDVHTLMQAIEQDSGMATEKYGHRSGIGGSAFFFVSGKAGVKAVDRIGVWLNVDVGEPLQAVLITGPIFGSALRDATGLLEIGDFNSFDFNALGAELNRLAEARAQPALRRDVRTGSQILFLAAGEIDDASGTRPVLKLVPIRVTPER